MSVHVCTIIARNYLAAARVLASSFAASNPAGTMTVLVIDDREASVDRNRESFEILGIEEIGIDAAEVRNMAAIYNVTELATAVKPWLLETLVRRFHEPVIYLDPDIMVFEALDEISRLAAAHDLVITPHSSAPIPRDENRISETEVLAAGIYNLGFIAVGERGLPFLDFWQERLRRECLVEPTEMRFVDQRWVDFAPAMFDAHILKDPTYNVAYWNLHSVEFNAADGRYFVDGEPLHFFHFSGYNPKVPALLSKYQGGNARILFSDNPDLKRICDEYGQRLFEAGFDDASEISYGYDALDNGMRFDDSMRKAYRQALVAAEVDAEAPPPNPFVDATAFVDWLTRPARRALLARYLAEVYAARPDLRAHFPGADTDEGAANELISWCWREAARDRFDYRLIQQRPESAALSRDYEPPDAISAEPAIEVSGYFRAEMGVGELGRNTVKAVAASGIPYSTRIETDAVQRQNLEYSVREGDGHRMNIVCVNADALPNFARRVGPAYFKDRYTVGVWAWELEEFPDQFDEAFDFLDEVWGCSEFTRDAIASRTSLPVFALPVTVETPGAIPRFDLKKLGIDAPFTFLFAFDLLSIFERKNPLGVVDAFTRAFAPGEGPTLVIKALNGDRKLADLERLKLSAHGRDDVVIIDRYLDHEENVGLFAAADCYVSLHRSEGLGLTIAEAMSLGKPVIATAYSGNMDFTNEENSFLVPFVPGSVPDGCDPYRAGATWAEPDLDVAGRLMREVYEHPERAREIGARAREYMIEHHSPLASSEFILERHADAMRRLDAGELTVRALKRFETDRDDGEAEVASPKASDETPPLIALAGNPVSYEGASRFPRLVRRARRLLGRLLAARDAQQSEVNMALAMGTEHLARLWNEMHASNIQLQFISRQTEQTMQSLVSHLEVLGRNLARLEQWSVEHEVVSASAIQTLEDEIKAIGRDVEDISGLLAEASRLPDPPNGARQRPREI